MNVTGFGTSLMSRFESRSEAMCHPRDRSGKKFAQEESSDISQSQLFLELSMMILREFMILRRRYKTRFSDIFE